MASVSGDFKEGGQWTATASSFSGNQTVSLSADVNPLSKVRTADLTISAAGVSKSCTVSLTQEASEFEAELTIVAIPAFAAGGGSYTATSSSGHIIIKRNGVVIDDRNVMPAFRFKSGSEVSWVTLSGGSGAWTYTITAENRALVAGGSRSATIEAQYSLDVGGVQTLLVCDVPISQVANFVETVSVSDASFAYSTIAAAGATVTPITDSTIAITMSSGSTLSSASAIVGYTYALTPSFSMTNGSGFTLNSTTTGSLTAASMGTTLGSRQSPTITYSLSLTYTPSSELSALSAKTVSGSDSSTGTATQGVNEVTSSTLAVTAFNYTGTVAASGGTSAAPNITVLKNRVYTSGATDSVPVTTYTKTFSIVNDYDSGATVDASAGLVTFLSRGTTVGLLLNIQVGLVVSADGLSANSQAGCTQAMNKIESFVVMDISFDWPQFSPAGESHLPTHVGEWCQATYSSGVVGERAKPPVGYTIASNTAVYSLAESSSVFTIVDASTGEVSAANMGRALGSRTSPYIWKDITIVLAAGSWANGTVENISGTGRARNVANQGVNAIGFRDLTITSFAYSATPTVSASGGTSVPTLAATETQFYTSGTVDKNIAVPLPEGSFALTTSGHGASVDSSTGVVTYASRGSVAGDAWSDSVTWTLTSHGLTATKSASVSQEANVETFVDHSNAYAADPSYDGRGNVVVVTGGTVTATPGARLSYTSGSTVVKDVSASSTSEPVALGSGASWDASSWTLTIPSAGTSVYPEYHSYGCTIEVTTPYGTTRFYMFRQANLQTLTGIRLAAPSVSGDSWISDWSAVPAAGGNLACAGYNQYSYTSGSTNEVRITDFSDVTVNTSVSWVEVLDDDATYPMSLHVLSRGEIAGDARSSDVSWTRAGFTSNSLSFMQVANVKTFTAIVARSTSSNPPTGIPDIDTRFWVAANGGVLTVSFIAKYSYSSGSSSEDVVSSGVSTEYYMTSTSATWDSANQTMTYISAGTDVSPVVYTAIHFTYNELTGTTSFGRQANEATYAVPVLTLSYSDIAASGGSVTPSKSFTQSVSYTSGSTSTVTSGGTWSYSGTSVNTSTGAVSASSLGTTVKSRSKITTATASLMVNGKTGSTSAAVYQQENYVLSIAIKSQNWVIPDSPTLSFPAEGATNSYTCYGTFTSGTVRVQNFALDDWDLSNSAFTKVLTANVILTVTAPSRGTTVGAARTSTLTVTLNNSKTNNKTLTDSVTLTQEANAIVSYGTPVVSVSYADIPAGGGSVTPSKSFTQATTYTSGSTGSISSGGSWSYSGTGVNTSTGAVSGTSLGTTEVSRTKKTDATATVTINGKSGSATVAVYQEANTIVTAGPVTITDAEVDDIPASGGTVSEFSSYDWTQDVTYTSGATDTSNYHTTSYSAPVTASSLGTTVKSRAKVGTLTLEVVGEKNESATLTLDVYQEANTAAYASPSITASYDDDIPAGGGTVLLSKSFTQNVTYTSGSTSTVSSGGSWSYSQTSGSGLNTSTGAVTAASLGTTAKARSQVASVRVQLTANSKTEAVMASAYQEANSRTWGTPTITTFEYRGTPAVNTLSAGADNRTPTLLATQTGTWTSGETETASLISSKTFTGGDVNTSTGNYTVTSLGNVVTARQLEASITVNITMNGKTASDSLSLYREANEVTYSDPVVTHTSPISVDASAGQYQLKPNFTQRAYYTSGSETPILSGSFTYAVKTALTGFTLAPPSGIVSYTANPSVSPRNGFVVTITGSGNGKSGTTDVTFNQAGANPTIWVSLNGTSYGSSVTVNLEGKSASEVSVYVKTNDTFDVS